jgi:hypothetical protein
LRRGDLISNDTKTTSTSVYCKFIGKSERELDRHIMHYAKHKQIRERLEMSSEFTAEEDYRVVAAGKTYKDEVSVDGTGHTSVVISVKLDLGRMRKPHSC